MTHKTVPLLPCPFCGGEPKTSSRMDEDLWTHNIVEWRGVSCADCDVGFCWPPDSEESAAEQWNRRAAPAAEPPEIAADSVSMAHIEDALDEYATAERECVWARSRGSCRDEMIADDENEVARKTLLSLIRRALAARPAVPDTHTGMGSSAEYIAGWNACRAAMLAAPSPGDVK